jgi:hypothetical protein
MNKNTQFVNSTLATKTTAEVNEQIEEELNIPDPQPEQALASLHVESLCVENDENPDEGTTDATTNRDD